MIQWWTRSISFHQSPKGWLCLIRPAFCQTGKNRVEEQDCRWPRTPTTINSQQSISQFETLTEWSRYRKIIQISKKLFRYQKIIQISKYLKCKIKHTLVLKGHQPDLWRYPGLVRIRKEGTWIILRKLPWGIHSEELSSGLAEMCATLC